MKLETQETPDDIFITYHGRGNGYYFPFKTLSDVDVRMLNLSKQIFHEWMLLKYCHDIIPLNEKMSVIDCGAFVGAFSIACGLHGCSQVFALEPSSLNYRCLLKNIQHYNLNGTITPIKLGMSDTDGETSLNISSVGCECSFLECDADGTGITECVSATRLDTFVDKYNIDINNLIFKIEAEGFEPEVFESIGTSYPRYITIDVSPERDNIETGSIIKQFINEHKLPYIIHKRNDAPFTDKVLLLERNY